jgi:hypothetical protein
LLEIRAAYTGIIYFIYQGMAYAILANLPPVYGLYAAVVPIYIYAVPYRHGQLFPSQWSLTLLLSLRSP